MSESSGAIRVGLVQMECGENPAANLEKAQRHIESAAAAGANIICLQELFVTRYFCQLQGLKAFELAEPLHGVTMQTMAELARALGVVLVVPFFERRRGGVFHNSAGVIDADGSVLGIYRKMHIPDDPGFYEKYYFTPGDTGFCAWDTAFGRVGVGICWDQWFPEAARLMALAGAEILFFPTAIGWLPAEIDELGERQQDAWETVQRAHGIANGCFIAAANRIGFEPGGAPNEGIKFWGQSFISAPDGRVIGKLSGEAEGVLVADVNLADARRARIDWPFFRDRRTDSYVGLCEVCLDQPPSA